MAAWGGLLTKAFPPTVIARAVSPFGEVSPVASCEPWRTISGKPWRTGLPSCTVYR